MTAPPGPSRAHVAAMFDGIARRYDLANRALSLGLDAGWRARVVRRLPATGRGGRRLRVLDVATGTADLAIALARDARVEHVVGVDVSREMLAHGADKVARAGLTGQVRLELGDALVLAGHTDYDVVTIAFGMRNLADTLAGLRAMRAALAPGGLLLVLELTDSRLPLLGPVLRWYRRRVLPLVGGLLTGHPVAYRYLDETIATFPAGAAFCELVCQAGFDDLALESLTLGSVTLSRARRPLVAPHPASGAMG